MDNAQDIKQFSNTREERARAILEIGSPETLDEFTYSYKNNLIKPEGYFLNSFL